MNYNYLYLPCFDNITQDLQNVCYKRNDYMHHWVLNNAEGGSRQDKTTYPAGCDVGITKHSLTQWTI